MARGERQRDGTQPALQRSRASTTLVAQRQAQAGAAGETEREAERGVEAGEAQRSRSARVGPVSMLRWRRQTHAFDDTNVALPALDESASDAARGQPITSGARPKDNAPPEKPVIIRGAGTATVARPKDRKSPGVLRSPAGRVVMIAAIVATLFASLAVVAPSGPGAGIPAVFQSYANAMPWSAPTATPHANNSRVTTNVSGGSPSQQAVIADIQSVFGPYSSGALNVARCESSFDAHAWNPTPVGGSHASGVFQILFPSTWNGTSYRSYSPYDEWANVRAAYEIFKRDGYSWREWQCQP